MVAKIGMKYGSQTRSECFETNASGRERNGKNLMKIGLARGVLCDDENRSVEIMIAIETPNGIRFADSQADEPHMAEGLWAQ